MADDAETVDPATTYYFSSDTYDELNKLIGRVQELKPRDVQLPNVNKLLDQAIVRLFYIQSFSVKESMVFFKETCITENILMRLRETCRFLRREYPNKKM